MLALDALSVLFTFAAGVVSSSACRSSYHYELTHNRHWLRNWEFIHAPAICPINRALTSLTIQSPTVAKIKKAESVCMSTASEGVMRHKPIPHLSGSSSSPSSAV